tara:strand:- start:1982 stop:2851 length:870 start_codon:yes stop_codon:yes gene_type:complete
MADSLLPLKNLPTGSELSQYTITHETLLGFTYLVVAVCVILPIGIFLFRKLTKSPIEKLITNQNEKIKELQQIVSETDGSTGEFRVNLTEAFMKLLENDERIEKKFDNIQKQNSLDSSVAYRVVDDSVHHALNSLRSCYWERVRLNHIQTERHKVMGRYNRFSQDLAGDVKSFLALFTHRDNGYRLSSFFGEDGLSMLNQILSDELFLNHLKFSDNNPEALGDEDIKGAFSRTKSHIMGAYRLWVRDSSKTLSTALDAGLDDKIALNQPLNDLEYINAYNEPARSSVPS